MIADGDSRRRRRKRTLLHGIWLMWVGIALQMDMGEAKRPFLTEDNDTVPLGSFELEVASTLAFDRSDRRLLFPVLGLKAGVADRVDVGLEGGYQFVRIEGVHEAGVTDMLIRAKVRFYDASEVLPSIGTTVGLVLPTADRAINPSGDLGFLVLAQLSGDVQPLTYFVNFGVAPTGNVLKQANLDDNLLWGVAFEISVRQDISLALDFPGGTQQDSSVAQSSRFGGIWRSPWQIDFDFAVIVGMTRSADNFGLTTGLTYQFPVFGGDSPQQASCRTAAKSKSWRGLQAGVCGTEHTSIGRGSLPVRGSIALRPFMPGTFTS
jgi:hypothetical protein